MTENVTIRVLVDSRETFGLHCPEFVPHNRGMRTEDRPPGYTKE